ncbi:MAG: deoxyhypusine synthase family protein [Phycisphaeraceae bacterium]|nr:deoxyhypusine synthase family protein [Phycisphaeraceae bacterium]
MSVRDFLRHHYRHFNAATLVDAAEGYCDHLASDGRMMVTLAGAMSTAELGVSLARMIREDKVHAICCTGANLEEDVFNLIAHDHYERIPDWRALTAADEKALLDRHLNRVTDTCIPEEEAFRRIEGLLVEEWRRLAASGERDFPHRILYRLIREGRLDEFHQIDPNDSWMVAAAEKDLPMFVPGWEDSTTGNVFAAHCIAGDVADPTLIKGGIEYMIELAAWYTEFTRERSLGFFQVGGGIAGDFPICVVPMLHQDLGRGNVPLWGYFCQIGDSTTSYGSYSGAVPNEKITWGKLAADTPKFMLESDATIVAPLVFQYVLES